MNAKETLQALHLINGLYNTACNTESDIKDHLPYLSELVTSCYGMSNVVKVVEFGVRNAKSTTALLRGLVNGYMLSEYKGRRFGAMVSYDINDSPEARALEHITSAYMFQRGDSLKVQPLACDVLFIDTLHTYVQLKYELNRHGPMCQQYIAIHDTHTFGKIGEDGGPGIGRAITEFIHGNPCWVIWRDVANCNGMLTLKRI